MRIAAKFKDGKLSPLEMEQYITAKATFEKLPFFWLVFEKDGQRRINKANRQYFGYVVAPVLEYYNRRQAEHGLMPFSKDQMHDQLARRFLGEEPGPMGGMVAKSTSKLDRFDFWEYAESIRAYFSQPPFGLTFPDKDSLVEGE